MSIDSNDPRLTAYALNEMDEAERAAFEKELDADARAEIDAIRALGADVTAELGGDTAPALRDEQRAAIEAAARPRSRRLWLAAAALLIAVGGYFGVSAMLAEPEFMWDGKPEIAQEDRLEIELAQQTNRAGDASALQAPPPAREVMPPPSPKPASKLELRRGRRRAFVGRVQMDHAIPEADGNTEAYDHVGENPFLLTTEHDTSTFSIDVDRASYANARRILNSGRLPPKGAVRIEEFLNYFKYDDAPPPRLGDHPFAATVEIASCPWNTKHRLARIGLKGKVMEARERPPTNLVFLVDVSGSMNSGAKLPLLKQSLKLLIDQLDDGDRCAIVVYAGAAGLVLPSTPGGNKAEMHAALDKLQAGGSTNGGAGIELAYKVAADNYIKGGANRVIIATDGDFNVGVTNRGDLVRLVQEKAKTGVFLSVLGFGSGNFKDASMEEISNKGNGNYSYIDTLKEGRRVLVGELTGTLVTIAKDVKVQVFFNPKRVAGYRLIGYENRMLKKEDFNDDKKDAGEIGAGHSVTALYELVPAGSDVPGAKKSDKNPFVADKEPAAVDSAALLRLRLRYKQPEGDTSTLMEEDVVDTNLSFDEASENFRWASAVAGFGMLLRESEHKGSIGYSTVVELARSAKGADPHGERQEFIDLVQTAYRLNPK